MAASVAKTSGPIPSIKSTSNNNNNNNSDSQDNSPTFPCASLLQAFKNDDFASFDEVKVFNEEGEGDCDPKSGDAIMTAEEIEAALLEEKSSLIRETEMGIKQELAKLDSARSANGSPYDPPLPPSGYSTTPQLANNLGINSQVYPTASYSSNGASLTRPGSPSTSFLYSDSLGSPPPAHIGGIPYNLADPGLRSLYSMPPHSSYPYSLISTDATFPNCSLPRYTGLLQPSSSPPGCSLQGSNGPLTYGSLSSSGSRQKSSRSGAGVASGAVHIKKPLNAFMLYMKEMRPKIVAECTLKESAAINQILGRRWHGLSREEQAKYYELARKERQLHMQMYPGWSARDNYAQNKKKKRKRMQEKPNTSNPDLTGKKMRSRLGFEQSDSWCKPCSSPPSSSSSCSASSPLKDDHLRLLSQVQPQSLPHRGIPITPPSPTGPGSTILPPHPHHGLDDHLHLNNNMESSSSTAGLAMMDSVLQPPGGLHPQFSSHPGLGHSYSSHGAGDHQLMDEDGLDANNLVIRNGRGGTTAGGDPPSPKYISL